MNTYLILAILFIHWIADFVCQTDKMATGKSKNWTDLLDHTTLYSTLWTIATLLLLIVNKNEPYSWQDISNCFTFGGITFVAHTITDYFTSRLNSKLWEKKEVHWFFVSIGFDQWLHYIQLFLTYNLLF